MCCSFWEKCINSQKTGLGCSTPLICYGKISQEINLSFFIYIETPLEEGSYKEQAAKTTPWLEGWKVKQLAALSMECLHHGQRAHDVRGSKVSLGGLKTKPLEITIVNLSKVTKLEMAANYFHSGKFASQPVGAIEPGESHTFGVSSRDGTSKTGVKGGIAFAISNVEGVEREPDNLEEETPPKEEITAGDEEKEQAEEKEENNTEETKNIENGEVVKENKDIDEDKELEKFDEPNGEKKESEKKKKRFSLKREKKHKEMKEEAPAEEAEKTEEPAADKPEEPTAEETKEETHEEETEVETSTEVEAPAETTGKDEADSAEKKPKKEKKKGKFSLRKNKKSKDNKVAEQETVNEEETAPAPEDQTDNKEPEADKEPEATEEQEAENGDEPEPEQQTEEKEEAEEEAIHEETPEVVGNGSFFVIAFENPLAGIQKAKSSRTQSKDILPVLKKMKSGSPSKQPYGGHYKDGKRHFVYIWKDPELGW